MQVQITIRGRSYTVRSDDAPEEIQAVARDLDGRMEDVARRTRSVDDYTVAVLTLLNIASESRRFRRELAGRLEDLDRDLAGAAAILDACLPADGRR